MSQTEGRAVKTLGIKLDGELHAQLTAVVQLEGITIAEAIRQAIEAFVANRRDSGDLSGKAQAMLDEIERDAAERRNAITALFPTEQTSGDNDPAPGRARGRATRQDKTE
jgi:predicted DNA-binding protein